MALDLDTSQPLSGIDRLRDLVHAIVSAHPGDESDWLEWKTSLDLETKQGCFHVAKAILGMANRCVENAHRACAGHGYLVVGAEPGNLAGLKVPDPAQWVDLVASYVKGASRGPAWDPTIVPVEGHDILVVTVDPPHDGDPLWPLQKELDRHRSGTLFVRKLGKTEPALAADVEALERRARAGARTLPALQLELVGNIPLPWFSDVDIAERVADAVDEVWEAQFATALKVGNAQAGSDSDSDTDIDRETETGTEVESKRGATIGPLGTSAVSLGIGDAFKAAIVSSGSGATPWAEALLRTANDLENRTLDEYTDELHEWAANCVEAAVADVPRRFCEARHGLVHLRITNRSTQYLAGVEVRVHVAFGSAKGFGDVPEAHATPGLPRPYGEPRQGSAWIDRLEQAARYDPGPAIPAISATEPRIDFGAYERFDRDTHIEDGSIRATLDAGDLRPRASYDGDEFYIMLTDYPPDGVLQVTWTATIKHRDGIIEEELYVPVQSERLDPRSLFHDRKS